MMRPRLLCLVLLSVATSAWTIGVFGSQSAQAAILGSRRLLMSSSVGSTTGVTYSFGFTIATAGILGSIELQVCSNDPFPGTPCTAPGGLDFSSASLTAQSGATGFSIHGSSTSNRIVLSRTPAPVVPQAVSYTFNPVTNPNANGTYYVRLRTFASNDASGPETDKGGIAFSINNGLNITTEVPPYLEFCVGITIPSFSCSSASGNTINFGELSTTQARAATSQFLATTNAGFGYTVTLSGTTMTAGNNTIPAMSGQVSAPGTSQFGLNARANNNPPVGSDPDGGGSAAPTPNYNVINHFRFSSNDAIAGSGSADDYRRFTVSYIVNVSSAQPPGRYAATISYICLANF